MVRVSEDFEPPIRALAEQTFKARVGEYEKDKNLDIYGLLSGDITEVVLMMIAQMEANNPLLSGPNLTTAIGSRLMSMKKPVTRSVKR